MQFDITQFGHLPVWAAILYVAWRISTKALAVWKEVTLAKLEHDQADRAGHREERRELVAGFTDVSRAVNGNTEATRELTASVRGFFKDQIRQGG